MQTVICFEIKIWVITGNLDSFWATFTFEKTFQSKMFQPSRNKVLITESDSVRHNAGEHSCYFS